MSPPTKTTPSASSRSSYAGNVLHSTQRAPGSAGKNPQGPAVSGKNPQGPDTDSAKQTAATTDIASDSRVTAVDSIPAPPQTPHQHIIISDIEVAAAEAAAEAAARQVEQAKREDARSRCPLANPYLRNCNVGGSKDYDCTCRWCHSLYLD
jgi:hypothetical protein